MALNDRQARIERELWHLQEQIKWLKSRLSQDTDSRSDEGDKANDLVERAEIQASYQRLLQKRRQLEHARKRIQLGVGNVCELCGNEIDPARLEALIDATRCIKCQERTEQGIWRVSWAW